jgi:hypothetical protein
MGGGDGRDKLNTQGGDKWMGNQRGINAWRMGTGVL